MRRRWMFLIQIVVLAGVVSALGFWALTSQPDRPENSIDLKVRLAEAHDKVYLFEAGDGTHKYRVTYDDGRIEDVPAEEFARRLHVSRRDRDRLLRVLNVTSSIGILWVALGFLGQVLFTGRMIVQWLVSEKEKRSVVPPAFWWMSLGGSTMLLVYFGWRKDPVGILGQSFGWFVYVRNLWLIHGRAAPPAVTEDPAPEPESGS